MVQKEKRNNRVLIVCSKSGFLGFLVNDISYYAKQGYVIDCVADDSAKEAIVHHLVNKFAVSFYDFPVDSSKPFGKKNHIFRKKLADLLKKNNYSIIHTHTPIVSAYVRMVANKYRKKGCLVIYTTHGLPFNHLSSKKRRFVYKTIESFLSKKTDMIITINKEDYEAVKKMKCKRVEYIPGVGVPLENLNSPVCSSDELKRKLNLPAGKIIVLSIGELSYRKNHIALLKAINSSRYKEQICAVILGKCLSELGTKEELQEYSKQNGIKIIMPGHVSNVVDYLAVCDFSCLPSYIEGLGFAGIESLAMGKPVIGSNVQGIKDYVINGMTGLLFNPYDIYDIAKTIDKMIDSLSSFSKDDCRAMANCFSSFVSKKAFASIMNGLLNYEV